jgi:lipopolysaccharide transport system permease protein
VTAFQETPAYVVEPPRAWRFPNLREVWQYRDLLLILVWRELKLRYRQTALGVVWVVLQPLLASLLLAVIFRTVTNRSTAVPYILIIFTGVILWNYFGGAVQRSGGSLVLEARLVTKVYFPRILVPLSAVGAAIVDFAVSLVILAVLLAVYRTGAGWRMLLFPAFVLLATAAAVGVSLWLAALNVKYRDFMYAAPFLLQIWMFASPVVYEIGVIPPRWRWLFELNPVVGFIEGARWSLLGTPLPLRAVWISILFSAVLCITGATFFRRIERELADII